MRSVVLALALAVTACSGSDLLIPVEAPASVHGLLRERSGELVEFSTERFEAVYDVETVQPPEWTASGGALMGNGDSARWQLPAAGEHTVTMTLFLADGRAVRATWVVSISARTAR